MRMASMVRTIIFILFLYIISNYYVYERTFKLLNIIFPNINGNIYAGIYFFLAISIVLGRLPLAYIIRKINNWISSYWLGIFIYLLAFFLLSDIVIFLGRILNIIPQLKIPEIRLYSGLLVVLLTSAFVIYGLYNANRINIVPYRIETKKSTLAEEMNIVMISDLHLGTVNSEKHLERIIKEINNLKPDIVCLPGDIFDGDYSIIEDPERAMEIFKSIDSRHGVYACLGNHDAGSTFKEMINFLKESNIYLLNDEYINIDDRLILLGRVDPCPIGGFGSLKRKSIEDIKESISYLNTELPILVMDHNPINIGEYGKEFDLILSGHTHKGQIFPGSLITRAIFISDYGYYQKDEESPHTIITSGVGTWGMPMRIGSNSEIVNILLY